MASVLRAMNPRSGEGPPHVRSLVRRYGERTVISQLDFRIEAGQFVALLGRSGSGKSTLLRALAQLDDGTAGSGSVSVPRQRAVLFQDARLLPWLDIISNVTLGCRENDALQRGQAALAEVGLAAHARAWPKTLSGGEQQRVALARALLRQPHLILADEPFSALDALTRIRMQALLLSLCRVHRPSVLFVTHDVDEALLLADRLVILEHGKISFDRTLDFGTAHRRSSPKFTQWRSQTLRLLGVDEMAAQL